MGYPDIPGYEIESEIGAGGMGVVYRARHLALDRIVALKVINPKFTSDAESVKAFAQEAKIVAKLSHPNIVSVYDFGRTDHSGVYYLSMQYVVGSTLRELLFIRKPKRQELASIIRQVADALDFAHRSEVVHRDIKPGNILLCPGGKAMVIDFGVAHGTHAASTSEVWIAAGTRSYMSPEQCKGHPASPLSDQYSLAVAVYEVLAGRLPFTATEPRAVMRQHIFEPPPPLRLGRTDILPRIENAVLRALSKTPEMRFPSVGAFARELEAAFHDADSEEVPVAAGISAGTTAAIGVGSGAATAAVTALPAAAPLTGPVSLVDGTAIVAAPRTVHRDGYLYATRGLRNGARRSRGIWLALILLLFGGLGAGGYTAYMRMADQAAADKAKARATADKAKAAASRSAHHTRHARRRSHSSSRIADNDSLANTKSLAATEITPQPKAASAAPVEKPAAESPPAPDDGEEKPSTPDDPPGEDGKSGI